MPGILFWLSIGAVTGLLARSRGRNLAAWMGLGLLFPCLAPVLVLVLPDLKAQARREGRLRQEQGRLREALRLERHRSSAFRRHALARLDAHDTALGLDTRSTPPALEDSEGEGAPADWFLAAPGGEPEGPMGEEELVARATALGPERLLVWRPGMADWVRFDDRQGA